MYPVHSQHPLFGSGDTLSMKRSINVFFTAGPFLVSFCNQKVDPLAQRRSKNFEGSWVSRQTAELIGLVLFQKIE
jgi:hypothetical protein